MLEGMYHTHAGSWIVLIVMFLLSYFLTKQKITHMILRLFYLVMIFSGAYMLFAGGSYGGQYHLKAVLAIALIAMMEMILVRKKKGKSILPLWIAMIVLLALVLLIAFGVIVF